MPKDPGNEIQDARAGGATLSTGPQWFGHPRGLSTLFFTEMWERFSYYGMRAVLILFMTEATTAANPGLGFGTAESAAIYGLYTFFVYVLGASGRLGSRQDLGAAEVGVCRWLHHHGRAHRAWPFPRRQRSSRAWL